MYFIQAAIDIAVIASLLWKLSFWITGRMAGFCPLCGKRLKLKTFPNGWVKSCLCGYETRSEVK